MDTGGGFEDCVCLHSKHFSFSPYLVTPQGSDLRLHSAERQVEVKQHVTWGPNVRHLDLAYDGLDRAHQTASTFHKQKNTAEFDHLKSDALSKSSCSACHCHFFQLLSPTDSRCTALLRASVTCDCSVCKTQAVSLNADQPVARGFACRLFEMQPGAQ